jgi:VanZ family protein
MAGKSQTRGFRQVRTIRAAQEISFRKSDVFFLILYSGFIFFLSTRPAPAPSYVLFPHIDKLFHAIEYSVLGCLWLRVLSRVYPEGRGLKAPIFSLIICLIYSAADESLQRLVPSRLSSAGDALADGAGAAIAIGVIRWARGRSVRRTGRKVSRASGL